MMLLDEPPEPLLDDMGVDLRRRDVGVAEELLHRAKIGATLRGDPACHGFLLRRHGLYTWGATVPEAVRHVEIIEFLLETIGRKEAASWRS